MKKVIACVLSFICAVFPGFAENESSGEGNPWDDVKLQLHFKVEEILYVITGEPDTFKYGKNVTEKMFEYARKEDPEGIISLVSKNAAKKIGSERLKEMAKDFVEEFRDSDIKFLSTKKTQRQFDSEKWKHYDQLMCKDTYIFRIQIDGLEAYVIEHNYARDDFDKGNEGLWLFEIRKEDPISRFHEFGIYDDRYEVHPENLMEWKNKELMENEQELSGSED